MNFNVSRFSHWGSLGGARIRIVNVNKMRPRTKVSIVEKNVKASIYSFVKSWLTKICAYAAASISAFTPLTEVSHRWSIEHSLR